MQHSRTDEQCKNKNESDKNQKEILKEKKPITEMKHAFDWLVSTPKTAEGKIIKLKDRSIVTS